MIDSKCEGSRHLASGVRRLTPSCLAIAIVAMPGLAYLAARADEKAKSAESSPTSEKNYTSDSIAGKVVWLGDALAERYDIKIDDDAAHAVTALETPVGKLHPIIKDARGRCFYTDERLRDIDVELLVRRYEGSPMVQVVRVYTVKPDGRYELDYWCDVCSIAMYELKPCECCQGITRLRERMVEKRKPPASANSAKD